MSVPGSLGARDRSRTISRRGRSPARARATRPPRWPVDPVIAYRVMTSQASRRHMHSATAGSRREFYSAALAPVLPGAHSWPAHSCAGRATLAPYDEPMVTAIVFVKADVARIPEVAEAIAALTGVSEVYSVTGQIDLIALVRVAAHA